MKFIILHTWGGKIIRINPLAIESYGVITDNSHHYVEDVIGFTHITTSSISPYVVKETPEEIDAMLLECEGEREQ